MIRFPYYGRPVNLQAPLNRGLVAWWLNIPLRRGGGRFLDLLGRQHLTLTNGPLWSSKRPQGRWGAIDFDGTNDYASLGAPLNPSVYGANPRTVSFWFNSRASDTAATKRMIYFATSGSSGQEMTIFYEDNGVSIAFNGHRVIFQKSALSLNTWYHFAAVIPVGATLTSAVLGYIDGRNYSFATEAGSAQTLNTTATDAFAIGAGPTGASPFNGLLDDVRVYNRALSTDEVLALYLAARGGYQRELNWLLGDKGVYAIIGGQTFQISLSGSLTPAGSVAKLAQKSVAGSAAPAGAVAKQTGKALSGAVSPSSALTAIKTVLVSLAGSITPAGALAKLTQKIVAGSIAPAGALRNAVQKALSGSITPSGTVRKSALKFLGGVIAPIGDLIRQVFGAGSQVTQTVEIIARFAVSGQPATARFAVGHEVTASFAVAQPITAKF